CARDDYYVGRDFDYW
nr:immunoglobulin heavy chain junction region [Mus musculus]